MRKFNEEKDGELWKAVVLWLDGLGLQMMNAATLPQDNPAWVHKDHAAGNPTFHCESGLSLHVLAFKRALDDGWTITSVLIKDDNHD